MAKKKKSGWGSKALRSWRRSQGISQEDLGAVLEISGAYVCQIESGERRPGYELMGRIRDLAGIELGAWG